MCFVKFFYNRRHDITYEKLYNQFVKVIIVCFKHVHKSLTKSLLLFLCYSWYRVKNVLISKHGSHIFSFLNIQFFHKSLIKWSKDDWPLFRFEWIMFFNNFFLLLYKSINFHKTRKENFYFAYLFFINWINSYHNEAIIRITDIQILVNKSTICKAIQNIISQYVLNIKIKQHKAK